MSAVVDLCQAVTDAINEASLAGDLIFQPTALRKHDLTETIEKVGAAAIFIVPGDILGIPGTLHSTQDSEDTDVMVVISAKIKGGDDAIAEMDELCNLVQRVWSAVRTRIPPTTARFVSRVTELEAEAEVRQSRLHFLRITTFTFRTIRAA